MLIFVQITAPPKVTNVKIIGELRENNKITVTGIVTGGTEGSSRVQWFKKRSSILDGEKDLEVLSASKIAKVGDVYFLGACICSCPSIVGHYLFPLIFDGTSYLCFVLCLGVPHTFRCC